MDTLLFEFPAKADYLLSVRLLVSSLGARMEMDIDEIDDLKSGAAEACLAVMGAGRFERIRCGFTLDEGGLTADISGLGEMSGGSEAGEAESELSRYMLEALMDDVSFTQDGQGAVTAVSFRKARSEV